MLRTLAVLLLLLGLATATPVVCLCAPDGVAGLIAQPVDRATVAGTDRAAVAADATSLVATSAAAAVASVVPAAAGVPSAAPWQLSQPVSAVRVAPPALSALLGQVWPPDAPPPQSA
jgi:hypothetical protein